VNRRIILLGGVGAAAVAGAAALAGSAADTPAGGTARAALAYPFRLGVASGDPEPDGVVLWTRLAPRPLNGDGLGGMPNRDVTVEWQVSTEEHFGTVAQRGSVTARPAEAHSVHVELAGLAPDSWYYYRFRAEGHTSRVGRTRTAPALTATPSSVTVLAASCAHYEQGHFTAYRRMAEERPDLILHLGDYIYEYGPVPGRARVHSGVSEILSLAQYRVRHAQYKADADLQAAHAAAPWLVVWDDHEVHNNYAGLVEGDPGHGIDFRARRATAYQAYYENMPLRATARPVAWNMALFRRVRWGRLATFHLLDTRQYRSDQACGDGWKVCPEAAAATRTITGPGQETWLLDGLAAHHGSWDVIGQQVFFAQRLDSAGRSSMDSWNGYLASRQRIQRGWLDRSVRNPVILTGDVHTAWANDLKMDYRDVAAAPIGVELATTSIASGGDGSDTPPLSDTEAALNPHLKFSHGRRGYLRTRYTPAQLTADFRAVSRITVAGEPVRTVASFAVAEGRPGLQAI